MQFSCHQIWCNDTLYRFGKNHLYSKTCEKRPLSKRQKNVFQDQLSLNAGQKEHSAILSTLNKLPFVIKIFLCLFLSGRFTQVLLSCLWWKIFRKENALCMLNLLRVKYILRDIRIPVNEPSVYCASWPRWPTVIVLIGIVSTYPRG